MTKIWMVALVSVLMLVGCANENAVPAMPTVVQPTTSPLPETAITLSPVTITPTPDMPTIVQPTTTPTEEAVEHDMEDELVFEPPENSMMRDSGFVSLDERIFRSDVIARVTMTSVSSYAVLLGQTSSFQTGQGTYDLYDAMIRFNFDVHEYLKGNGGATLTADMQLKYPYYYPSSDHGYYVFSNEKDALEVANAWIANDDDGDWIWGGVRWWEDRESIVFLEIDSVENNAGSTGQSAIIRYKFLPHDSYDDYALANETREDGYSINHERSRVWLPSASESSGPSGASDSRFLLGEKPEGLEVQGASGASGGFATDISLAGLKARVEAVADLVKQNEGVAGYEECLLRRYESERDTYRPHKVEISVLSGLPAGSVFDSGGTSRNRYKSYFFKGQDERLFEFEIEDSDDDPSNGYRRNALNKRPLIQGKYEVEYHTLRAEMLPCMSERIASYWTITATAPDKALHEAFFDPVLIGASVGADGSNGVLKPTSFTAEGIGSISIERIEWADNQVKLRLFPHSRLAEHHIDFIALDGKILRLDFDNAVEVSEGSAQSLAWGMCIQPWQDGDLLMLRISKSESDLIGVTNNSACAPTPTPTAQP